MQLFEYKAYKIIDPLDTVLIPGNRKTTCGLLFPDGTNIRIITARGYCEFTDLGDAVLQRLVSILPPTSVNDGVIENIFNIPCKTKCIQS